jgi:ETC complex I subunit conserved region
MQPRSRRIRTRQVPTDPLASRHDLRHPTRAAAAIDCRHGEVSLMTVRIFKPAKTAMQSGLGRTKEWVLEAEATVARSVDPLMGWTSGADTSTQTKLYFDTKDEAIVYAKRNGLAYAVTEPEGRRAVKKSYADNFRFGRIGSWTH